jgi:hypothetical protein
MRQLRARELHHDEEQADDDRKIRSQEVLPRLPQALRAQRRQDLEGLIAPGGAAKSGLRPGARRGVALRRLTRDRRVGSMPAPPPRRLVEAEYVLETKLVVGSRKARQVADAALLVARPVRHKRPTFGPPLMLQARWPSGSGGTRALVLVHLVRHPPRDTGVARPRRPGVLTARSDAQ